MIWKKVKAGEYKSDNDRFIIVRDFWAEESTGAPDEETSATEWFLYDNENMIDGYPTLKRAKKVAETILASLPSGVDDN